RASFLLYCTGALRSLPSFPTRRSSDLVQAMKAEGIEYEERMELLEEVTYPRPLEEGLVNALRAYRETHPWVRESDLSPKSVVREDRKSTRLNSSHVKISYAVFCLKKKK